MSKYSEQLKALLAEQDAAKTKVAKPKETQKFEKDELLKKFFVPIIPQGKQDAKYKIRLLPPPEGEFNPFVAVNFHYMKYGTNWEKFLCLKENKEVCPLCEALEALKAKGDATKEELNRFRTTKFWILKLVDRTKEEDGVKFWRFKDAYKKDGEFDKLKSLIDEDIEIFDAVEGCDLTVDVILNDKSAKVKSIIHKKASLLSSDDEDVEKWLNDDTTWKDVFKAKPAQYLEDVVFGRAGYWDKKLNKYVNPAQSATPSETTEKTSGTTETVKDMVKEDAETPDLGGDDEDLPF